MKSSNYPSTWKKANIIPVHKKDDKQREVENTLHYFLHCHHYSTFRMGLMNKVNQIDENFSYLSDDSKVNLLLYRDSRFDDNKNNFILSASSTYILETERFRVLSSKVVSEFLL